MFNYNRRKSINSHLNRLPVIGKKLETKQNVPLLGFNWEIIAVGALSLIMMIVGVGL